MIYHEIRLHRQQTDSKANLGRSLRYGEIPRNKTRQPTDTTILDVREAPVEQTSLLDFYRGRAQAVSTQGEPRDAHHTSLCGVREVRQGRVGGLLPGGGFGRLFLFFPS